MLVFGMAIQLILENMSSQQTHLQLNATIAHYRGKYVYRTKYGFACLLATLLNKSFNLRLYLVNNKQPFYG
jgi:hypothetical protein